MDNCAAGQWYLNWRKTSYLEGIVLHAFEGKAPFSDGTQAVIEQLKSVYGCDLSATDSHKLTDEQR